MIVACKLLLAVVAAVLVWRVPDVASYLLATLAVLAIVVGPNAKDDRP